MDAVELIAALDQLALENATLKAKLTLYVQMYGEITISGEDSAESGEIEAENL